MSLLPEIYQKEVHREKVLRISFLFLFSISGITLIGIIFMLPSYFALVFSKTDVLKRLDAQQKTFEHQDIASFEDTIAKINKRVALYKNNESMRRPLSVLLERIAAVDNDDIRLSNAQVQSDTGGLFILAIKGTAKTRDSFLSYVRALKDVPEFSSVHSPISNLLRESDVTFDLTISINKESYFYVANP